MYQVSIQRSFIAQHYLIGGDWGKENTPHSHPYNLEIILSSPKLDQHYYLVDITLLEAALDKIIDKYGDKLLNDMEEFKNKNPSIELFASLLHLELTTMLALSPPTSLRVKLWENSTCWAAYSE